MLAIFCILLIYKEVQQQNTIMSDNTKKQRKNKITVEDLDDSPAKENDNKIDYSAFSTAIRKDKLQTTYDKTFDNEGYDKIKLNSNILLKYKSSLNSYQKQFKSKPKFKEIKLIIPDIDECKSQQKQNKNYINSSSKMQNDCLDSKSKKNQRIESERRIEIKIETSNIVRSLFTNSGKDYNFEYRKKKFFENFKKIS